MNMGRNFQITDYAQVGGNLTQTGLAAGGSYLPDASRTTPAVEQWLPSIVGMLPGVRLPFQVVGSALMGKQLSDLAGQVNTAGAPVFAQRAAQKSVELQDAMRRRVRPILDMLVNPKW